MLHLPHTTCHVHALVRLCVVFTCLMVTPCPIRLVRAWSVARLTWYAPASWSCTRSIWLVMPQALRHRCSARHLVRNLWSLPGSPARWSCASLSTSPCCRRTRARYCTGLWRATLARPRSANTSLVALACHVSPLSANWPASAHITGASLQRHFVLCDGPSPSVMADAAGSLRSLGFPLGGVLSGFT